MAAAEASALPHDDEKKSESSDNKPETIMQYFQKDLMKWDRLLHLVDGYQWESQKNSLIREMIREKILPANYMDYDKAKIFLYVYSTGMMLQIHDDGELKYVEYLMVVNVITDPASPAFGICDNPRRIMHTAILNLNQTYFHGHLSDLFRSCEGCRSEFEHDPPKYVLSFMNSYIRYSD